MKQILFLVLLLFSATRMAGQIHQADSLVDILHTQALSDKEQMQLYLKICAEYQLYNIDGLSIYAAKGLQLAQKGKDLVTMADFYWYVGLGYDLHGSIDSAMVFYEKALDLAVETKNKNCEAMARKQLGYIYTTCRQYKDNNLALENFLKALQIAESGDNQETTVLCLAAISGYHTSLRNSERSAYYAKQAEKIAKDTGYKYGQVRAYYALAEDHYENDEKTDTAISYALKGLEIARSIGDKKGEVYHLQILGYYYCLGNKEYDIAEKYATECMQVAEEFGEPASRICAQTVLSYVYLYQRRFEECKATVLNAWETDSFNVQISTLTNLAAAYLYTGELDKAHDFFVNYVYLMEENSGKQFQRTVADMETLYQTEKKEVRIAALEKERRLYVWLGVAGILLALALALALWQKIVSARKERQLIASNAVQDGEMGERARLASDLHDRLSGSLSAVKIQLNNAESIQLVSDRLDKCIEEIRRITHNLMPRSLQFGLRVALGDFAAQFPNVHFHFFGEEKCIRERLEFVIYCCANELVNNSLRYAGANTINIQLVQTEKHITLTVQDDGCGFDEKTVAKGIGLKNIRDRVASCGGKLDIVSSPGQGTEATIEVKIDKHL